MLSKLLFQLKLLSLHLSVHVSMFQCVLKAAPIPAVVSQNITNNSRMLCVKSKICILGHSQTGLFGPLDEVMLGKYIKTYFSVSAPPQCRT